MHKVLLVALLAVISFAAPTAGAQQRIVLFQNVPGGPPNYSGDSIVGTEPAGGYDQSILFVPFKVTVPSILGGVVMPMKGQDLIVQLATGPDVPFLGQGQNIPEPRVLASRQLPGNTPFAVHDIAIPGNQRLVPGQQYFIMLSAANLRIFAGTWTGDYRAQNPVGSRLRGQWFVSPGNHPGALSLIVYGTAAQ